MIRHTHTNPTELNFSKLKTRIMQVNDPFLGKYNDIRKMLFELTIENKPTLIMATGGSKVIAYYLQLIIERLGLTGIICEVIEPRDYFYKVNRKMFSNIIVISASGNTNGIIEALLDFKGNKYLITENMKDANAQVVSWGNELYDKEKSFISLANSLGPIQMKLKKNDKIKELLSRSKEKIDRINANFKDNSLIQIMSGYETKSSASVLECNLTEVGLASPVIHDKGSYAMEEVIYYSSIQIVE